MKALSNKDRIMEPGEAGVRNEAGFASAEQKDEEYEKVPYERLLRFAKLIGLTEVAPPHGATFNEKKPTDKRLF